MGSPISHMECLDPVQPLVDRPNIQYSSYCTVLYSTVLYLVIQRNSKSNKSSNGANTNSKRATASSKKGIVPRHKFLSKKEFLLQKNL